MQRSHPQRLGPAAAHAFACSTTIYLQGVIMWAAGERMLAQLNGQFAQFAVIPAEDGGSNLRVSRRPCRMCTYFIVLQAGLCVGEILCMQTR